MSQIFPRKFILAWCQKHGITEHELLSRGKIFQSRHFCALRFKAMRDFKLQFPDMSYKLMGRYFNRDHTTVMSAFRVLKKNRDREGTKKTRTDRKLEQIEMDFL